jgi:hypothetical protein
MSRTTVLVLIAMGAAIAGFAFSSSTGRNDDEEPSRVRSQAAGPQTATLGWRETYGSRNEQLVFSVETLEILRRGWRARLRLENRTKTSYRVASTLDQPFGLMVFSTGAFEDFTRLNEERMLPTVRPATNYDPRLPSVLEPGDSWTGTISAPGALVAGSWVRVVFGGLTSVVEPNETFSWITDHTYQLRA